MLTRFESTGQEKTSRSSSQLPHFKHEDIGAQSDSGLAKITVNGGWGDEPKAPEESHFPKCPLLGYSCVEQPCKSILQDGVLSHTVLLWEMSGLSIC